MSPSVVLSLLVLAVMWASAFAGIKLGLEGMSAPHLTLVRHLVASACFLPVLALARWRLWPRRGDVPRFALLGLLGITVYHLALNTGELRVSAGATSLVIATAPVVTALVAAALGQDRLPAAGWVGSAVAFVGVALIVLGDGDGLGLDPYVLFVLLSAITTSFYFVLQGPLFARYRPLEVTAFATWAGTLPLLLLLPGLRADLADAGRSAVLAGVYLGVVPSAIAYSLFTFALSRAPVTLVTTSLYTVPLFSLLFAWWLLGEVPSAATLLGGAVALLGVVLVNRSRRPPPARRGGA